MSGPLAPTVMLLDDNRQRAASIADELQRRGIQCIVLDPEDQGESQQNTGCALVASAQSLHDWRAAPERPYWGSLFDLFVFASNASLEEAHWAGKQGARDYFTAPVDFDRLARNIEESFQRLVKGKAVIQQIVDANFTRTNGSGECLIDPTLAAKSMIDLTQTPTMDDIERQAILYTLTQTSGNVGDAARVLGLGPATVYRKIKRYGIRAKSFLALSDSH